MLRILLILFIALLLIEIGLLILLGRLIGAPATLSWILGTAALGIGILYRQDSLATIRQQQAPLILALLSRWKWLATGSLLLIPGLLTDLLACLLVFPPAHRLFSTWLNGLIRQTPIDPDAKGNHVLEGDFWEVDEGDPPSMTDRRH